MQEHIHIAKKSRIISQSFFIWLFVATQIGLNIFAISEGLTHNRILAMIYINILLGLLNVPAIFLFGKYYRHSFGKKFIITYDSLKFINEKTGEKIEIKNSDIEKIYLIESPKMSKLPWLFHEYFALIDNKKNKIIVTSYFMDISDFWLDTLTRKVNSDNLIRLEKTYPII